MTIGRTVHRARFRVAAIASVAALASILAACSSSGSGTKTGSGNDTTGSSGGGSATTAACMTATKATVAEATKAQKLTLPTSAPDLAKVKGKSLWFISPSQAFDIIVKESQAFSTVAKKAGMKPVIFNGNSSVQQWNVGIQQAVAQHAGAIVLVSIQPALVSQPLAAAKKAGIPVIDINNGSVSDPLTGGLAAHVETDVNREGQWQASWALQTGGCTGSYGIFYTSVYQGLVETVGGMKSVFAKQCPSCKLQVVDTPSADVATKVGPSAQTLVHRTPDLKAIISASDAQSVLMVPALSSIGSKVPLVGGDPTDPNLQFVAKGNVEKATVMWGPTDLLAYEMVDEMARLAAGQPAVVEDYPSQLVTTETIGDPSKVWSSLGDYAAAYDKLWGLSS